MCRGGGDLHYLLCLISNTATVGTIFLASTTVLCHRLLLQTTCYNHLRLLLHLHSSRKEKQKNRSNRLGTPLSWGGWEATKAKHGKSPKSPKITKFGQFFDPLTFNGLSKLWSAVDNKTNKKITKTRCKIKRYQNVHGKGEKQRSRLLHQNHQIIVSY